MSTQTISFRNQSLVKYLGDAPRVGDVVLTIDWQKIAKTLGTKAAYNKSRKTALAVGIKVKFVPKAAP